MLKRLGDLVHVEADRVDPERMGVELVDHYSIPAFDQCQEPDRVPARTIKSAKFVVPGDAVLLARLNPHIPRAWLPSPVLPIPALCSTEFLVMRPRSGVEREWLYFLIQAPDFVRAMLSRVTGTSGSHQRVPAAAALDIPLAPPRPTAHRRALNLLVAIDRKLHSNRRALQLLELRSQSLLRRYVADGPLVRLGDVAEFIRGVSYRSAELRPSTTALVSLKCFGRDASFQKAGLKPYVGRAPSKKVLTKTDLVIAQTDLTQDAAILGRVIIPPATCGFDQLVPSLDCAIVRPKAEMQSDYLRAQLGGSSFLDHCRSYSTGTTVLHLAASALPNFEFRLHTPELRGHLARSLEQDRRLRDGLIAEERLLRARLKCGISQAFHGVCLN